MNKNTVKVYESAKALAQAAAVAVIDAAEQAIAHRGRFTIALSGGSTPPLMYKQLVNMQSDWSKWVVFVSDERWVPEDDAISNLGVAMRELLGRVAIPSGNIMHPYSHDLDAVNGAERYEMLLRQHASDAASPSGIRLDLVLLGVGDDGHTASLFPGKPAIEEQIRLVTASPHGVLPPPVERITFTFPAINSARQCFILAVGDKKSDVVAWSLKNTLTDHTYPVQRVRLTNGELTWMLDKDAASKL